MKRGTINKCQNQEKQIKMFNHGHHRLHGRKAKSEWLKWTQLNWTELIAAGYWRLLTATTFSQNKFYFSLIFYFSFYFHYFFRIICFAIFAGGSAGVSDRWRANSDGMANVWCMHCLLAAQTINPWAPMTKLGKRKKESTHTSTQSTKGLFVGAKCILIHFCTVTFIIAIIVKKKLNESKYILKWHKWKAATTSYFKYLSIVLQFPFYLLPEVLYIFLDVFFPCAWISITVFPLGQIATMYVVFLPTPPNLAHFRTKIEVFAFFGRHIKMFWAIFASVMYL